MPSACAAGSAPAAASAGSSGPSPASNGCSAPLGRPERKAPRASRRNPLVPAHPVVLEVTVGVIRRVRAAHDGQLVGEGQPVFRIDVRKSASDRRVHGQPEQVGPSQVRFRQSEEQLHRLADAPLAGRREVDHRVRQVGGVVEHRPSERQVARGGRGRNDDGEVAEPQRPAGLSRRSRASSRRSIVQISAAIVSSSRRASGAGTIVSVSSGPGRSALPAVGRAPRAAGWRARWRVEPRRDR